MKHSVKMDYGYSCPICGNDSDEPGRCPVCTYDGDWIQVDNKHLSGCATVLIGGECTCKKIAVQFIRESAKKST